MGKVRNANLDMLKIIACVGVVGLHTLYKSRGSIFYYLCSFSIPVFFMVSGSLLINRINYRIIYSFKKSCTLLAIILSWNIIYTLITFLYDKQLRNPLELMMKNFLQQEKFGHFWFLYSLILIYLIYPLIRNIFKRLDRGIVFTTIVIVFMITIDIISTVNAFTGKMLIQANVTQALRLWTWLGYFMLGGVLGNEKVKLKMSRLINIRVSAILCVMLSILIIWFQLYIGFMKLKITLAEYHYDNIFTILWVTSIFLLISSLKIESTTMIKTISSCTMGIYILHPFTIALFIKILEVFKIKYNMSYNILLWIGITVGTLLISLMIIKIPFLKKLIQI